MKIKIVMLVNDLDTGKEDHSYSALNSRAEYNSLTKKALDSMIEVPSIRITFRILDVEA